MDRYKYTETEKQINSVLNHQEKMLDDIKFPSRSEIDASISQSEKILKSLGYKPELIQRQIEVSERKKPIVVPPWENLCLEAEAHVGSGCTLESLFSEDELKNNEKAIQQMNADFNALHHLDKFDVAIAAVAAIVGAAVEILLVGIPEKTYTGLKAGPLSNYIRDYFNQKFPAGINESFSYTKVPYDTQDNRNTKIYVEGLSTYYHRLLSLGHDPILGFVVGVSDIMSGKMTTIDKSGKIVSQVMENYAPRKEQNIFRAIAKQIAHFKSDITTAMGLPAPLMALFNLFQFGSIGEEEQTIAEIVQGMYYEGYDFIHFCSMSVPVMLVEVIVRLGYAIKRIKEGHSIKESIPFSLNQAKHPKLSTMLFIGHTGATAVNLGKVLFTENPLAINFPQWIAFAKYSFCQLKWVLIKNPTMRDAYVSGKITDELDEVYSEISSMFSEFAQEYPIIFS